MIKIFLLPAILFVIIACNKNLNDQRNDEQKTVLEYGGDFSIIMKRLEDLGGISAWSE